MLLGTELKTPFRWYDSESKKNRFIPNCSGECLFKLFMPYDGFLPFQIRQPSVAGDEWTGTVTAWKIYTLSGLVAHDLDTYKGDIIRFSSNGAQYFTYTGNIPMITMAQGYYYSKIELSTGGVLWSEDFFVDRTPGKEFLKIRWYNKCDVGSIVYSFGGYTNEMWLEAPISRNEPNLLEEGIENGAKQFFPTMQYYTDNFTVDEFVPEYVLSAMTIINMHDYIEISEPYSGNLFVPIRNFKTSFQWEGTDCQAVITCKFQRENSIIKSRCCANEQIIKIAPYTTSVLTNLVAHWGFVAGSGLGYQVSWNVTTPSLVTEVEVKGNFDGGGDDVVVVPQPTNSIFIAAPFPVDTTLEVTPINKVNGRVRLPGDTYYVVRS